MSEPTNKKTPEFWKDYNSKNKLHRALTTRSWQRRIREEVIQHYGGRCTCCYERTFEFLTIDRESTIYRKAPRKTLSYWLWKNDFPEGYRVTCWNCNEAIRRHGFCPHRETAV